MEANIPASIDDRREDQSSGEQLREDQSSVESRNSGGQWEAADSFFPSDDSEDFDFPANFHEQFPNVVTFGSVDSNDPESRCPRLSTFLNRQSDFFSRDSLESRETLIDREMCVNPGEEMYAASRTPPRLDPSVIAPRLGPSVIAPASPRSVIPPASPRTGTTLAAGPTDSTAQPQEGTRGARSARGRPVRSRLEFVNAAGQPRTIQVFITPQEEPGLSSPPVSFLIPPHSDPSTALDRWKGVFRCVDGEPEWLRRCRKTYLVEENQTQSTELNQASSPSLSLCGDLNQLSRPADQPHARPWLRPRRPFTLPSRSTQPASFQVPQPLRTEGAQPGPITAYDLSYGADLQGIAWGGSWSTRERFRDQRLQDIETHLQHQDFRSMSREAGSKCLLDVQRDRDAMHVTCRLRTRYHFWKTVRSRPVPTADHFQLRHLLCAISSTDVILSSNVTTLRRLEVSALNMTTGKSKAIHGLQWKPDRHGTAYRVPGTASLHSKFGLVATGYFDSRVIVSDLGQNYEALCDYDEDDESDDGRSPASLSRSGIEGSEEGLFRPCRHRRCLIDDSSDFADLSKNRSAKACISSPKTRWRGRKVLDMCVSDDGNENIVNSVLLETSSWSRAASYCSDCLPDVALITACNDCAVTEWTLTGQQKWKLTLPWCANHVSMNPARRLLAVGADSKRIVLLDLVSRTPVATLDAHEDFTFSSSWHPDPNSFMLATGNQDATCRIWDIRFSGAPLFVIGGACSGLRCLSFSPDGQSLALAESKDVISVYNVPSQFQEYECIDFFGEPTGLSFSPDASRLFVGLAEPTYGGVIELRRGIPADALDEDRLRTSQDRTCLAPSNANQDPRGMLNANQDPCGMLNANQDPCGMLNANQDPGGMLNANQDPDGMLNANQDPCKMASVQPDRFCAQLWSAKRPPISDGVNSESPAAKKSRRGGWLHSQLVGLQNLYAREHRTGDGPACGVSQLLADKSGGHSVKTGGYLDNSGGYSDKSGGHSDKSGGRSDKSGGRSDKSLVSTLLEDIATTAEHILRHDVRLVNNAVEPAEEGPDGLSDDNRPASEDQAIPELLLAEWLATRSGNLVTSTDMSQMRPDIPGFSSVRRLYNPLLDSNAAFPVVDYRGFACLCERFAESGMSFYR